MASPRITVLLPPKKPLLFNKTTEFDLFKYLVLALRDKKDTTNEYLTTNISHIYLVWNVLLKSCPKNKEILKNFMNWIYGKMYYLVDWHLLCIIFLDYGKYENAKICYKISLITRYGKDIGFSTEWSIETWTTYLKSKNSTERADIVNGINSCFPEDVRKLINNIKL